jgi:hypothetical protein
MDIETRAKRAAKRRNKKIAQRFPLFADQFATNPGAEKIRLEKLEVDVKAHFQRQDDSGRSRWLEGLKLRDIARQLLPDELWKSKENTWNRWHGNAKPEHDGHRIFDYWWQTLKGTSFAFQNCPHAARHGDPVWWEPRWNFLERDWVETGACPSCGLPRHLTLLPLGRAAGSDKPAVSQPELFPVSLVGSPARRP